ncbi:MAG: transposase [Candidatus Micrarchaeota archaeon]
MKESRIIKKIKRLLRQASVPEYLHRFGPKTYAFWKHVFCLLIKQACKMSYERVSEFLRDLGFAAPTASALCKCLKRLTVKQLELLLQATNQFKKTLVAATDGLYFSQVNPSFAYLKRVKRGLPRKTTQSVGVYDTRRKKWLGVQTRRKQIGEYKLATRAMQKLVTIVSTLVGDKGFDINKFHEFLKRQGIKAIIPVKKNTHRGFYRNRARKFWRTRTYHRRSLIESAISRLKRLFGGFLYSRQTRQQRKEVLLRMIADNLNIGGTK